MANIEKLAKSKYKSSLEEAVRNCDALRKDTSNAQDVTLAEYVQARWQTTMESFYDDLGIDPATDTIENIVNLPDKSVRWLLPEVFRDAIRLGLRKAPIYNDLIAATQSIKTMEVTQPMINMSDATPQYVGIAETIRLGDVSFGQKTVKVRKFGRGISLPYEVKNFVSLNIVSIFLQDFGIKMGHAEDMLALDVLINGDQAGGGESAPVIGVATAGTLVYRDLTKIFLRMARLGRLPTVMVGGETMTLDMLDLDQFSKRVQGTPEKRLNVKTPLPDSVDLHVHSGVPANQVIMVDPSLAMIKYVAQPLLVESEKIVSNQTESTYVSFMSGFGIAYRDARVILDKSVQFGAGGNYAFPTWMDPSAQEQTRFKK